MSNSDVLTVEAQADSLREITNTQVTTIDSCVKTLNSISTSKKVTESNFKQLSSVIRELETLRELFITRLFNALKRGDMLLN